MDGELIYKSIKAPPRRSFILSTSKRLLDAVTDRRLPDPGEAMKFISIRGGVAPLSFIAWVAQYDVIEELQASTLRIGPRQYQYLDGMARSGRLKSARFVLSSMQGQMDGKRGTRNYAEEFTKIADRHGWRVTVVNNHSKVILLRTVSGGFYVLETSSNLNDNPKIEQYSFENSRELYDFYSSFFDKLTGGDGE